MIILQLGGRVMTDHAGFNSLQRCESDVVPTDKKTLMVLNKRVSDNRAMNL